MLTANNTQQTASIWAGHWLFLFAGIAFMLASGTGVFAASQDELGRRIYEEGILPSGAKLQGLRLGNMQVEGRDAACVNCHRQSGMGSKEGRDPVPPITGLFLFGPERQSVVLTDASSPKNFIQSRKPYTDESLAAAIRKGVDRQGIAMNALMPRYTMDDASMKALSAYLRQLSIHFSPGVSDTAVRFATIIAPGMEPEKREAMLAMMRGAFQQRNASHTLKGGRTRAQVQEARRPMRKWELSVWELQGAPDTWGKQLADNYAREPVFAVISGFSNGTWAPVHEFCESNKVPCLFPSVDLPVQQEGFYSLYYSRGVALEADVLARHLLDPGKPRPQRVVQVRGQDEAARSAAQRLREALTSGGMTVEERVLAGAGDALEGLGGADALVFWLRPADLAGVADKAPKLPSSIVYFSGTLAGGEAAGIPEAWRTGARLAFPFEIGVQREKNTQSLRQWLKTFRHPLVNEKFQSEVFFNLVYLSDITMHMLDNYYRDYLVERTEDMLAQDPNATVYPRLSLGPHQRFASKGAYIARIGADGRLTADSEWIVP